MKGRKNRDRAAGRRGDAVTLSRPLFAAVSPHRRISASILLIAFCLFPFVLSSSAHEPITTKVRFNKELVRILQRNCLTCHHPGGIAFSLATYDEARPWAKAIKEEVLEKRMPPWHAVKGYGDFSNGPTLTQRDIDLIVNWVEGGAPKGEDKDLPSDPLFSNDWQLGKPDLILKPETGTTVAADANETRVVTFPTTLKEDRWLTAVDVLPGNPAVVHCATVFVLTSQETQRPRETMTQVQDDAPAPVSGVSPVVGNRPAILAKWMPGQKPVAFESGTAQLIPAGTGFAMMIHYRGSGEPAKDLSALGLYFSKTPPHKRVSTVTINDIDGIITASTQPQRIVLSSIAQTNSEAIAILPSTHPSITSLQATAYRPDGTQEVLIWVRGHRSDWQPTYYFRKPVLFPKGTRVEVIAYIDGSYENSNDFPAVPEWSDVRNLLCTLLTSSVAVSPPR
ncbi:MAG TPA: cytochrome c [Blastocatellia bacterium]|nr:cytochrome c [Blastocatellia bacterium]